MGEKRFKRRERIKGVKEVSSPLFLSDKEETDKTLCEEEGKNEVNKTGVTFRTFLVNF